MGRFEEDAQHAFMLAAMRKRHRLGLALTALCCGPGGFLLGLLVIAVIDPGSKSIARERDQLATRAAELERNLVEARATQETLATKMESQEDSVARVAKMEKLLAEARAMARAPASAREPELGDLWRVADVLPAGENRIHGTAFKAVPFKTLVERIQGAKQSILVEARTISHPQVIDALLRAREKPQVEVDVLVDPSQREELNWSPAYLVACGMPLRMDSRDGHSDWIVVDGEVVIAGAPTFAGANGNICFLREDKRVAEIVAERWAKHAKHSQRLVNRP